MKNTNTNLIANKNAMNNIININNSVSPSSKFNYAYTVSNTSPGNIKDITNNYLVNNTSPNVKLNAGVNVAKSQSINSLHNTKKISETLVINDWDPILEYEDLKPDYDNTSEIEFKKILRKTEHLMILKEKIEKGLKEKDRVYEKKFKDIENTILDNQKKLSVFKQVINYLIYNLIIIV